MAQTGPSSPLPVIITGGFVRRMVIDGGRVWIEESRMPGGVVIALLVTGVFFPFAAGTSYSPLRVSWSLPAALPFLLGALYVFLRARTWPRAYPTIAPSPELGWRRIAVADPQQQLFVGPWGTVPLHEVQLLLARHLLEYAASRRFAWSLELRWRGHRLPVRDVDDSELASPRGTATHELPPLARALQLLHRHGFSP